ncbi:MAG: hypothetical protein MJD61_07340 [Proteobacteria bacterium]|nr:hypothetical protein [Pseudomonadota bacterium]
MMRSSLVHRGLAASSALSRLARALGICSLLAVLCGFPSHAAANGRYPHAQQLIEDPQDPGRVWLRVSFGLLTIRAGESHWSWICERSMGYSGELDPGVGVLQDGSIIVGLTDGLTISRDHGCSFEFVPGPLMGNFVTDVTVDPNNPARALALASPVLATGVPANYLFESTDNGTTWTQIGGDLGTDLLLFTLETAPSDPNRIYASGVDGQGQGVLLRSTDRGRSWMTLPIPGTSLDVTPFIGAVHPTKKGTVFVRASGIDEDLLLHTANGGRTWMTLLRDSTQLLGLALSPDGSTILAGFGNKPGNTMYDPKAFGIWRASTADFRFVKVYPGPVYCLKWTAHGLYACANREVQGFDLGLLPQVDFPPMGVDPFAPQMLVSQLPGPLACPANSTTTQFCPGEWPMTCMRLGACPVLDGGVAAGDAGGVSGPDSGASDSGPSNPPEAGPVSSPASSGCGCVLAAAGHELSTRTAALGALLGLLAYAAGLTRRRRRVADPGHRRRLHRRGTDGSS